MNELKENTTHVIVQFVTEINSNGKDLIDLVPHTWLKFTNTWICYFPQKEDWHMVDAWAKISKPPEQVWKAWEVIIIKEAANYDQGKRRLAKAYTQYEICSTGEETDSHKKLKKKKHETEIVVLGEKDRLTVLNAIPPYIPAQPALKETNNTITEHNIDEYFKQLMSRFDNFELTMKREIENAKRSILYDLHTYTNDIKNTLAVTVDGPLGVQLTECTVDLVISLPLNTIEQFEQFNEQLLLDTNKQKTFKKMMTNQIIGVESITKGISKILTALLGKDIQLQYSACGRECCGQKKKSFCDTYTFKCMRDVLMYKFSISEKEVISKMSRWFTGAKDRHGGRKERKYVKEKENNQSE